MEVNTIYWGDCKDVLSETFTRVDQYFAESGYRLPKEFADLIYLDPPFFSGKKYEILWPGDPVSRGFDDSQWGYTVEDLKNTYIPYMRERIQKCYNVLKLTGSFYLHCDWHAGHYLKQLCDEIFGYNNFQNEIIWHYTAGARGKNKWARKHDNIYFYTKSDKWTFNWEAVAEPFESGMTKWRYTKGGQKGNPMPIGRVPDDVFNIQIINTMAKERVGYPTQKPEALLERIIKASTCEGDIVLDPFCGCGTTLAVAYKLGRQFIGIDIYEKACHVMMDRLIKIGAKPKLLSSVVTPEKLKKLSPLMFQDYIIELCFQGRANLRKDKGIDGFTDDDIPIQVKQSDKVGRNFVDNFETALTRYYSQIGNENRPKRGIFVGYYFTSDAMHEQTRARNQSDINIDFYTVTHCCNMLNDRYRQLEKIAGWYEEKQKTL